MKRYEKYKNSGVQWIGKVPSHWNMAKLKYDFHIYAGATPKTENPIYWDGDIIWITPADYKTSDKYVSQGKRTISKEGYQSCNTQIVPKGSLIFSKRAPIGTIAIAVNELCTNQGCLSCVPKDVSSTYFFYIISVSTEAFELLGYGATFKEISANDFANVKLPLPPLSEQQAIASYLDAKTKPIDDIIAKREKQIELLEVMKSAIVSRTVTKGLNPDAKMKDSGIDWIGEVPEEWEISKVKYIANVCGRIGYRGYTTNDLVSAGEGALTIGGKHITHNYLNLSDPDYISWEKYYESPEIMLEKGDIVMSQRGSLGKSALIDREIGEATINPSLVILKRIKANGIFLHYYLISNMMQDYINLINTATAVPMISQNQIENIPVALPPLSEQQAIASYLDSETSKIDTRIAKRRKQIELLQEYKQALITAAVTGKIDVREYIS